MKVLIVFAHPAPYKVRIFNELAKKVDLDVIFERTKASDRPDSFYNCNEYNFNVTFYKKHYIGTENSNNGELVRFLKKHYHDYDLVVMNGYRYFTEMRAISYMNRHHLPYVQYINGGVIHKDHLWRKWLKRKYIRSAAWYMSPCKEADDYLVYYGADPDRIFHYPYSTFSDKDVIDEPVSGQKKAEIRKKYDLPEGTVFVSASQFIERKNNLFLLSLFRGRPEKLVLIGSGPLQTEYEKFIKENDMSNVFLKNFMLKDELFELFQGCDYFITLSKEDIYGHTTVEAMANGLPVISSDKVVSSAHLIQNGENGYLVDINDRKQVLHALDEIGKTSPGKAIETARECTVEKAAQRHAEIFQEIVGK